MLSDHFSFQLEKNPFPVINPSPSRWNTINGDWRAHPAWPPSSRTGSPSLAVLEHVDHILLVSGRLEPEAPSLLLSINPPGWIWRPGLLARCAPLLFPLRVWRSGLLARCAPLLFALRVCGPGLLAGGAPLLYPQRVGPVPRGLSDVLALDSPRLRTIRCAASGAALFAQLIPFTPFRRFLTLNFAGFLIFGGFFQILFSWFLFSWSRFGAMFFSMLFWGFFESSRRLDIVVS